MSEESLVVKLKGDTADLDKKTISTKDGLNQLNDSTKLVDESLKSMSDASKAAVTSLKSLNEKSKSLNGTITGLNSKLIESRDATKKSADAVDKLSKELKEAKEAGNLTAKEIDELDKSLVAARGELGRNRKATNALNGELKDAKAEYSLLQTEIKATTKDLGKLDKKSQKSGLSMKSLKSGATLAAGGVGKLAKAAIAVATALTTMITLAAKDEQELQVLASTARTTTGDFEALAFATKQYSLDAKGTADAMNDVNERLAEFSVGDGAGAFDDFARAMGISKDEAMDLANELKELSGEDALRELVNQMEEAGTSTADMNFVLKSLSNDLAYSSKLFADNGKELDRLKDRYNAVNAELSISQEEAKALTDSAESFDMLTATMGNSAKVISAQLAPALDDLFNKVIEQAPDVTNKIVDLINSFKPVEDNDRGDSLERLIEAQKESISELEKVRDEYEGISFLGLTDADEDRIKYQKFKNEQIAEETKRLKELEAQLKAVNEAKEKPKPEDEKPENNTDKANAAQLKALEDRYKTELELENQKYEADRKLAQGNAELLEKIEAQHQENLKTIRESGSANKSDNSNELQSILDSLKTEEQLEIERYEHKKELLEQYHVDTEELTKQHLERLEQIRSDAKGKDMKADQASFDVMDKLRKDSVKGAQDEAKGKADSELDYLNAAVSIGNSLLEDKKGINYALTVANTAAAIMESLKVNPYGYANVATLAATGAAQLAAISSASKSGGSSASVPESASGAVSEPTEPEPQLQESNFDTSGQNTMTFKFDETGNMGELGAFFNKCLVVAKQDGL